MKLKSKEMLSNIFLIASILILIGALVFINSGGKDDHRRFFLNLRFYSTTSGSMEPTMKIRSLVVVQQATIADLAVGDIVCFLRSGDAIAHRVIGITPAGLQTQGDNNSVTDALIVLPEDVIGKSIIVMNWVADFLDNLETPTGIIKVVVLPLLSVTLLFVGRAYLKVVRNEKKQKLEEPDPDPN